MPNTVDYNTFRQAARDWYWTVKDKIDEEYPEVYGEPMGCMVDLYFEVSKKDGTIGIRLDNNFGVVPWEMAEQWSAALHREVELAKDFPYLGYRVDG